MLGSLRLRSHGKMGHCGARCGIPRSARPEPDRRRRGLPSGTPRRWGGSRRPHLTIGSDRTQAMTTSVEAELVRLRTENAELRAGLEARTQENALLLQMIADVISTLKLDQVLRH